jgi:hypothetical protein
MSGLLGLVVAVGPVSTILLAIAAAAGLMSRQARSQETPRLLL